VTFAGNYDHIAGLRSVDRVLYGLATIVYHLELVLARRDTLEDVLDDLTWVLGARIVVGDDESVALFVNNFGHKWSFGAVTVATASEDGYEPFGIGRARGIEYLDQTVWCVRVVDNDCEILATLDRVKASEDDDLFFQSGFDRLNLNTQWQAHRRTAKHVVEIELPKEFGVDCDLTLGCNKREFRALAREFNILGCHVGTPI